MTDDLLKYRSEFPILEKAVYLISHSLGAMPRATYDRLHEYADIWASRGVRAWAEGWWDKPVSVGNEVAQIIGADPNTVVMHQNVSVCQSLILSCLLPLPADSKRNKIVCEELNFPSVMYVYEAMRARTICASKPLSQMMASRFLSSACWQRSMMRRC
jgi:kynureninase